MNSQEQIAELQNQTVSLLAAEMGIEVTTLVVILILVSIWSLIWKGLALWKAAGLRHKWWFIILLVVNTVGILEIIYLFFIAKKYKVEIEERTG